jgi:hypothetical protein
MIGRSSVNVGLTQHMPENYELATRVFDMPGYPLQLSPTYGDQVRQFQPAHAARDNRVVTALVLPLGLRFGQLE